MLRVAREKREVVLEVEPKRLTGVEINFVLSIPACPKEDKPFSPNKTSVPWQAEQVSDKITPSRTPLSNQPSRAHCHYLPSYGLRN